MRLLHGKFMNFSPFAQIHHIFFRFFFTIPGRVFFSHPAQPVGWSTNAGRVVQVAIRFGQRYALAPHLTERLKRRGFSWVAIRWW